MKFGNNLAHLSIPEWKVYNLEYNDLKASIRELNRNLSCDMQPLRQKFIDNFEYLNLFVMTKAGELERRLKMDITQFTSIKRSFNENDAALLARLNTLHYDVINEVSIEIRKLTKFIVVQKIAVKKIFKKLIKHYPDQSVSKSFVAELNLILQLNPYSFVNFDLSKITTELLFLLNEIDTELRCLLELIHRKPAHITVDGSKKSGSVSTIKSSKDSMYSQHSGLDDLNVDANFGAADQIGKFDLVTVLKKNFSSNSLVPKDIASRNDLSLSLDVYLSIPKVSDLRKASIIYLTSPLSANPSWIMSYEDLPLSIVMAYTGGLRKYSYCCLLRKMVSVILAYLNEKEGEKRKDLKQKLGDYISCGGLSSMTRTTLDFILNCDLTPLLTLTFNRARYFLSWKPSKHEETAAGEDPVSPLTPDSMKALITTDKKEYEDSFYMILDEDIFTSNVVASKVSFETNQMDPFPFNSFSIFSNDLHLHEFEDKLITEINGNVLRNKPPLSALNKLPCKIQNLFNCAPIYAFKGFSIFDYMNSCYFNVIPENPNNHYSRILNLNLLKNYENIEISNKQETLDKTIIQSRSNLILHRQQSCRTLFPPSEVGQSQSQSPPNLLTPLTGKKSNSARSLFAAPNESVNKPLVIESIDYPTPKATDFENYSEENVSEDGYLVYLGFQNTLDDNFLNKIVLAFVKLKYRSLRAFRAFNLMDPVESKWKHGREKRTFDIFNEPVYDSINDEPSFFNDDTDYQIQFMHDYDSVVSFLAFSLCFNAVFITGLNLGIICSILNLQDKETNLNISDNPMIVLVLTLGFLFALTFSMSSINLHFQQFRAPPIMHSSILWVSLAFVNVTIMWSIIQMMT